VIRLHRFVDHLTAITAMRASDCLLIFLGNREVARLAVAGKTYEYLRSGRPIIAITYDGDTVELIRESHAGWVVNPDDVRAIKAALREAVCKGPKGRNPSPIRREFVEQFRYDRLAEKLAGVFDTVIRHDS
jgi:glycosyltransferase involved in cell wall biosynthesis